MPTPTLPPNAPELKIQKIATKLTRTRGLRLAKIQALFRSVSDLDAEINSAVLGCTPAAREVIEETLDLQNQITADLIVELTIKKGAVAA